MRKYAAIFIFLIFGVMLENRVYPQEIYFSDLALFRIQNQIYFLSDIQKIMKDLEVFRCLKRDSLLLKAVELNVETYVEIPVLNDMNFKENRILLDRLLNFIKVKDYALNKEKVNLSQVETKHFGHCGSKDELLSPALYGHLRSEYLLQERFPETSFGVSELELKEILLVDQEINSHSAKKIIKQRKMKEALQFYVNSLLRQVPHELLVVW